MPEKERGKAVIAEATLVSGIKTCVKGEIAAAAQQATHGGQ
jgi:hypothetical protein